MQDFSTRLRAFGDDYVRILPTDIGPEVVIAIQLLCHEIHIYIIDHNPAIDSENIEAFYSIYERCNALVNKIKYDQNSTREYFNYLRLLIDDLTRIWLGILPLMVIANEMMMIKC